MSGTGVVMEGGDQEALGEERRGDKHSRQAGGGSGWKAAPRGPLGIPEASPDLSVGRSMQARPACAPRPQDATAAHPSSFCVPGHSPQFLRVPEEPQEAGTVMFAWMRKSEV